MTKCTEKIVNLVVKKNYNQGCYGKISNFLNNKHCHNMSGYEGLRALSNK